jgi:hypothetical protein
VCVCISMSCLIFIPLRSIYTGKIFCRWRVWETGENIKLHAWQTHCFKVSLPFSFSDSYFFIYKKVIVPNFANFLMLANVFLSMGMPHGCMGAFPRCQFHKHFMSSFCTKIVLPKNYNPNCKHIKAAQKTFTRKSCS